MVSYPSKFAKGSSLPPWCGAVTAGSPVETVADVAAAWLAGGGAHAEPDGANHLVLHTA